MLYPGVRCPLAGKQPGEIDFVVVRENTEGEYAQVGGVLYPAGPHGVAVQSAVFTRHGTERVIRFAFDLARRRNKKRLLTSVTKSNAQGFSMGFWDSVFAEVARDYPDVRTESLLVDAACMDLVRRPEAFDVMVASNLFGDILTDLSAAITGSLGLAPSANLNPAKTFPSMFEPVHGSAPDIAGRGIANPMAAMLSGVLMLDFLGETAAAALMEQAVLGVLTDRREITPDLGGTGTTRSVSDAVVARVQSPAEAGRHRCPAIPVVRPSTNEPWLSGFSRTCSSPPDGAHQGQREAKHPRHGLRVHLRRRVLRRVNSTQDGRHGPLRQAAVRAGVHHEPELVGFDRGHDAERHRRESRL